MAMAFTPEGRPVWVPDNLAPLPQFIAPEPPPTPPPGAPAPIAPTTTPEVPSVTGGALPTEDVQLPAPAPAPPQPDYLAATVDNDPKVLAAKEKAYAKQQAVVAKAAREQAVYAASPEGQIAQGVAGQQRAIGTEAQATRAAGDVEAEELRAVAALEQSGREARDRVNAQMQAEQEKYQLGLADKQKAVNQAVTTEANYKVDDNRRWKEMGTGKTVMFWISAALSGLGDALQRKSGPNMALQMMQAAIDRDVDLQLKEREQLGKRIGTARSSLDEYIRIAGGDLKDARTMKIAEEYERHASQMRQVAASYGSDKAKIRGEAGAAHFEGLAEQLKAQAGEAMFNRDLQREQAANQRRQTQISAGHLALANKQFEFNKETTAKQLALEAAKLDQAGNVEQGKFVREHGIGATVEAVLDDAGQPVLDEAGQPTLRQRTIVAPYASKEKLTELQSQKAAADTITNIMDEAIRLREKHGWSSSLLRSKEYQELKSNWAALKLELKDMAKLGVIAGPDEALMNDYLGTGDPTQFRDPLAGMQKARENTVAKYNSALRSVGATDENGNPATYAPPQQHYALPAGTPEDIAFKESLKGPLAGPAQTFQTSEELSEATPLERYTFSTEGITPSRAKEIRSLLDKATSPEASRSLRDAALARLQQGAEQGQTQQIREAYTSALQSAQTSQIPVPKEEPR